DAGRRLGMDAKSLHAIPRFFSGSRCHRRVQRQIHAQPNGPARRLLCHRRPSCACHLPQLLSEQRTVAIFRRSFGPRRRSSMTKRSTSTAATNRFVHSGELSGEEFQTGEHLNSKALVEFQQEVLSGLLSRPKTLPCKYFYDARGSRLFEEICKTDEYYVTRTEIA